jgi:IS30 family transposase
MCGDRGCIDIVNGVSTQERSMNIDNRKLLGHRLGNLASSSKNIHVATLVDRKF